MELYYKFIILGIVLLTFYLLYRLHQYRIKLFIPTSILTETFSDGNSIMNTPNNTLMMNQYLVRASFHSAYNQSTKMIDLGLLSNIVKSGVRFLDFEIYNNTQINTNNKSGVPCVGYCDVLDPNNNTMEIANEINDQKIQLYNVLQCVVQNKPVKVTDPLFLHFRIKTSSPEIYSQIAQAINSNFPNVLFKGDLNIKKTSLAQLQNMVIIIVDKANSIPNYKNYADCSLTKNVPNCSKNNFINMINLESGTSSFPSISQVPYLSANKPAANVVTIASDNKNCMVGLNPAISPSWTFVFPNPTTTSNPNICAFVPNYAFQIIPYRYDYDDENLAKYENLFGNNGFISLANAILYLKNKC